MVGILIAGHGGFPSGVLSAVNLVAGNPGNVAAVDFVEGMSTDDLTNSATGSGEAETVTEEPAADTTTEDSVAEDTAPEEAPQEDPEAVG